MQHRGLWFGLWGALGGIVLAIIVGLFVVPALGLFDMRATGSPGLLDWWGEFNREQSLRWRAPGTTMPASADWSRGMDHFNEMCVQCHGTPVRSRDEWAREMLPSPPELWREETQSKNNGQLRYIIRNGVRMSGMPAFGPSHSEEELWDLVAAVRHLDGMQATPARGTTGAGRHASEPRAESPENTSGPGGS